MMSLFSEIAMRLLRFENREFGEGATDDEIRAAERSLGVRIQGGYREFLKQFGWGGVEHIELYGLGVGVPPHLDLLSVTKSEREEMEPRLQHHLIPIANDGGGNLYCLDTNTPANEPAVVFWDHTGGRAQIPEIDADDFASWLDRQLDGLE